MKRSFFSIVVVFLVAVLVVSSSSCKKTVTNTVTQVVHDTINHVTTDTIVKTDTLHIVTMSIQPGVSDGQDTYVSKLDNDPSDGNTNVNSLHEMVMARFLYNGQLATWRSYLKFDSVSEIPSNAKVLTAKLYLYGPSSSISFSAGNTYYPGSPNPSNPCVLQEVTGGNWDQTTLTWNNAPATTATGQVSVPASTSQWNYDAVMDVTAFVSDWVATPANNFGVCLRLATEQDPRVMIFATSESASSGLRPKLVITYQY